MNMPSLNDILAGSFVAALVAGTQATLAHRPPTRRRHSWPSGTACRARIRGPGSSAEHQKARLHPRERSASGVPSRLSSMRWSALGPDGWRCHRRASTLLWRQEQRAPALWSGSPGHPHGRNPDGHHRSAAFPVWRTFKIEARFGFNRMTPALFVADLAKSCLLGLLIGGPVVLAAMTLMDRAGPLWWLWAWAGWLGLMLLMTWAVAGLHCARGSTSSRRSQDAEAQNPHRVAVTALRLHVARCVCRRRLAPLSARKRLLYRHGTPQAHRVLFDTLLARLTPPGSRGGVGP